MKTELRLFEGRHVSMALRNGDRIDDCQLVSGGRPGNRTVWVFWNSTDVFIPAAEVVAVWETCAA